MRRPSTSKTGSFPIPVNYNTKLTVTESELKTTSIALNLDIVGCN